jgi:hypothetical protein
MKKMQMLGVLLASALALAACSQKSGDQSKQQQAPGQGAPAAPNATNPDSAATAPAAPGLPPAGPALPRQKAPDGTTVSFVGIKDGDTVTSPFKVGFAVTGAKVAPAGTSDPGTGHFHLIIDSELPPQDGPLPANDHVKHYGKGQTEDTVTLPPGSHTLQIELADGLHVPFNPPVVSERITVTVK